MNQSEYLWRELAFFENRIAMLDTKASIILAVQMAILGAVVGAVLQLLLSESPAPIAILALLLFLGGLSLVIALLLLHTIRPTKHLLSLRVKGLHGLRARSSLRWRSEYTPVEFERRMAELAANDGIRHVELIG